MKVTCRLTQVNPVHSIYYLLLWFDTTEGSCRIFKTLSHLQILSVASHGVLVSIFLYKRVIAFSYPLLTGCSIRCLINNFASPFVYLIRWVSLPRASPILLSTTSLNKVMGLLDFSRFRLKSFMFTSGADCCFNK